MIRKDKNGLLSIRLKEEPLSQEWSDPKKLDNNFS